MATNFRDLQSFLAALHEQGDLVEIDCEVDPCLEAAEIHRRVIAEQGPALLFKRLKNSSFPAVTNLFGTKQRVNMAFGEHGEKFIKEIASLPEELLPPSLDKLWAKKHLVTNFVKLGLKQTSRAPVTQIVDDPPALNRLPALTTWKLDGGPFLTLPLVYTEHPDTGIHNLGMYRIQIHSDATTGLHMQIGKGGGFHLSRAKELGRNLPVNIFLGGPPTAILAAIAPLPENVPELLLGSLLLGEKLRMTDNPRGPLPLVADAEFALVGTVDPEETHPEGPFGDHYGYYSLKHDYPLFRCDALLHRKNAVFPATVVGKPVQEDFYIGDYLQELLSPIFPLVMPAVKDLWSYGDTGYHSLAAAVVQERYKREAMASAFRILGEGQLSLTKFLLAVDRSLDLQNFVEVFEYILERADFRSDLYIFSHLSMDTLDYTGPVVNEGSKGVLLGMGDPIRQLSGEYSGDEPQGINDIRAFCRGCLVVSGPSYVDEPDAATRLAAFADFADWPLIILADSAEESTKDYHAFLWSTFTRFEPAADIYAKDVTLNRFHPSLSPPVVIDARMKPNYPDALECDPETKALVDRRWSEYFPKR